MLQGEGCCRVESVNKVEDVARSQEAAYCMLECIARWMVLFGTIGSPIISGSIRSIKMYGWA